MCIPFSKTSFILKENGFPFVLPVKVGADFDLILRCLGASIHWYWTLFLSDNGRGHESYVACAFVDIVFGFLLYNSLRIRNLNCSLFSFLEI